MPPKAKKNNSRRSPPRTRSGKRHRNSDSESSPSPTRKSDSGKRQRTQEYERSSSRSTFPPPTKNRRDKVLDDLQKQVREQRQLIDQLLRKSTSKSPNEGEPSIQRVSLPPPDSSKRPARERLGPTNSDPVSSSDIICPVRKSNVAETTVLLPPLQGHLRVKLAST